MHNTTNAKRPFTDQSPASSGNGSTAKRSKRITLARTERAQIKILHNHGLTSLEIALSIGCSEASVEKIINAFSGEDDSGADYDFVGEAFKAKYPNSVKNKVEKGTITRNFRPNLTRGERSMVRILHDRGLNKLDIATEVGCTINTVTNVLSAFTVAAANDDPVHDYEYVTEAFKVKYPPPSHLKKQEVRKIKKKEEEENLPSIIIQQHRSGTLASNSNLPPRQSLGSLSNVPQPQQTSNRSNANTSLSTHTRKVHNPPNHSAPGPSRHHDNIIEIESSPAPSITEDLETPVSNFLSGLDLDLSPLHNELKAQGLGTSDRLFAISKWPEEKLHQMFKEALPKATPPDRFMLVMGLREYAGRRRWGLVAK